MAEPLIVPSSKDNDGAVLRSEDRRPASQPGVLICSGQAIPVEILNLSRSGASVRGECLRERGELIWLLCRGIEKLGRVIWARDGKLGLQFETPFSVKQMDVLSAAAAARP